MVVLTVEQIKEAIENGTAQGFIDDTEAVEGFKFDKNNMDIIKVYYEKDSDPHFAGIANKLESIFGKRVEFIDDRPRDRVLRFMFLNIDARTHVPGQTDENLEQTEEAPKVIFENETVKVTVEEEEQGTVKVWQRDGKTRLYFNKKVEVGYKRSQNPNSFDFSELADGKRDAYLEDTQIRGWESSDKFNRETKSWEFIQYSSEEFGCTVRIEVKPEPAGETMEIEKSETSFYTEDPKDVDSRFFSVEAVRVSGYDVDSHHSEFENATGPLAAPLKHVSCAPRGKTIWKVARPSVPDVRKAGVLKEYAQAKRQLPQKSAVFNPNILDDDDDDNNNSGDGGSRPQPQSNINEYHENHENHTKQKMLNETRRQVMKRAHAIRREAAHRFNVKPSSILFSECMKLAWKEVKDMTNSQQQPQQVGDYHATDAEAEVLGISADEFNAQDNKSQRRTLNELEDEAYRTASETLRQIESMESGTEKSELLHNGFVKTDAAKAVCERIRERKAYGSPITEMPK